jgi:hypothetical protein
MLSNETDPVEWKIRRAMTFPINIPLNTNRANKEKKMRKTIRSVAPKTFNKPTVFVLSKMIISKC